MTTPAKTVGEAYRCDLCRSDLGRMNGAMVFWGQGGDCLTVTDLVVAHKRCMLEREHRTGKRLSSSAELSWMASDRAAVFRLSEMAYSYRWTGEQLSRLIEVAWAATKMATDGDRRSAEQHLQALGANV